MLQHFPVLQWTRQAKCHRRWREENQWEYPKNYVLIFNSFIVHLIPLLLSKCIRLVCVRVETSRKFLTVKSIYCLLFCHTIPLAVGISVAFSWLFLLNSKLPSLSATCKCVDRKIINKILRYVIRCILIVLTEPPYYYCCYVLFGVSLVSRKWKLMKFA